MLHLKQFKCHLLPAAVQSATVFYEYVIPLIVFFLIISDALGTLMVEIVEQAEYRDLRLEAI